MTTLDHKMLACVAIGVRLRLSFISPHQLSRIWPGLDEYELERLLSLAATVDRKTLRRLARKVALLGGFTAIIGFFFSSLFLLSIAIVGHELSIPDSALLRLPLWTPAVTLVLVGIILRWRWTNIVKSALSKAMRGALVAQPGDAELIVKIKSQSLWRNPVTWLLFGLGSFLISYVDIEDLPLPFSFDELGKLQINMMLFFTVIAVYIVITFFPVWRGPKSGNQ